MHHFFYESSQVLVLLMDDEGLQEVINKLEDAHSRYPKLKDVIRNFPSIEIMSKLTESKKLQKEVNKPWDEEQQKTKRVELLKNEVVVMLEIIGGEHVEIKKIVQLVKE